MAPVAHRPSAPQHLSTSAAGDRDEDDVPEDHGEGEGLGTPGRAMDGPP